MFRSKVRKTPEYKILLVGETSVGKTSICRAFVDGVPVIDPPNTTIGVDFVESLVKVSESDEQYVKLQIWDTAGMERFRTINRSFYRNAHAVIFVYDLTDAQTYFKLQNYWFDEFDNFSDRAESAVRITVGNKLDIAPGNRKVLGTTAQRWAFAHNSFHLETSTIDMTGIRMVFQYLADELFRSDETFEKFTKTNNIELKSEKSAFCGCI